MDLQRLPVEVVYQLSQEYREQAYAVSAKVKNEEQLKQYCTLISMAIKCLRYIKRVFPLSIEQDLQVTLELVDLLLQETHNLDLAESFVSSLRERLLIHNSSSSTGSLVNERMQCELLLLCRIPLIRGSKFDFKAALRSCDHLVQHLSQLKDTLESYEEWKRVFQYVSMLLSQRLGKHLIVRAKYDDLWQNPELPLQWQAFITLSYTNYLLDNRFPIPLPVSQRLGSISFSDVRPKWYAWKLMLQLTILVYQDKNITEKLNEFKCFFAQSKDALTDSSDDSIVQVGSRLCLSLDSPFMLNYQDLKNMLLLFQSVSFLVNCYDKKASFSVMFLPKVVKTTTKLIDTMKQRNGVSLNEISAKLHWYEQILSLTRFYQVWQDMLLEPHSLHTSSDGLLHVMSQQAEYRKDPASICDEYQVIKDASDSTNETKLLSLLNTYLIRASLVSEGVERQKHATLCNIIWDQITKRLADTDLRDNATWDCALTMTWIMTHFEPFSSNPIPATDDERNHHIEKLRLYYNANKLRLSNEVEDEPQSKGSVDEVLKLKKSLMLQILLNYLGGRMLEQDLETICQISAACCRLAKIRKLPVIQYVTGLWHLANCTLAMKTKEVTITRAKLESLVKKICIREL